MSKTISKIPIACPLCQSKDHVVKYRPSVEINDPVLLYGAASGVLGTQTLVRCRGCGFIYENPRYSEDIILQGYSAAQEQGHDSQYEMRVESFYRTLKGLSKHIPAPGARVLDVGTAGGGFLVAAKKYGYEPVGLEPCHYLVESGRKRGFEIKEGILKTAGFPKESFDMICFWDVLEHVTDPISELKQAWTYLKPNGVLLVNYPDIGTLMAKLAGKRFWWLLSVHLIHFDRKSLGHACDQAGFRPFLWKSYWQTLSLGYLFQMSRIYFPKLGALADKLIPAFIKNWKVSYYASQTTCLAVKK